MKKSIQTIIIIAFVAIIFAGCNSEPINDLSMSKPAKYEVTSNNVPVKIKIEYTGRINQTGGYTETDPQPYSTETTTPWEYSMLSCKDFTYILSVENIDTTDVILTAKVIIDDNTVAEDTGKNILLYFEQ